MEKPVEQTIKPVIAADTGPTTSIIPAKKQESEAFRRWLSSDYLRNILLIVITLFVLSVVLVQARQVLIPVVLAVFLSAILSPFVFKARRFRVPRFISAALLLGMLNAAALGLVLLVAEPAGQWLEILPDKLSGISHKLSRWTKPIEDLNGIGESVSEMATVDKGRAEPIKIDIEEQSWLESMLVQDVPVVAAGTMIVFVLSYFLLLSQGRIARSLAHYGQNYRQRRQILHAIRAIKTELSIYLLTISVINALLGVLTALILYLIGMPNPAFWGLLAALLNFAPYIGPLAFLVLLFLGGLTGLPGITMTFTACGVYILINLLEGSVITPAVIGRRLSLTPAAVFLSVILWTWLWGVAGALLAAPLLACFKIISDNLQAK